MNKRRLLYAIEIIIAVCIGPIATIAPLYVWPPVREYNSPLFPTVRTAIENYGFANLGLFVCLSIILGLMTNRNKAWVLGALTMVAFPIMAVAEMIVDPNSHNLFPIEFIMYGIEALFAVAGVYLGRLIRKRAVTLMEWKQRAGNL